MKRQIPLTLMQLFDPNWTATLQPNTPITIDNGSGYVRAYAMRDGVLQPIGAIPENSSRAPMGAIENPFEDFAAAAACESAIRANGGESLVGRLSKVFSHQKEGFRRPWLIVYVEVDL